MKNDFFIDIAMTKHPIDKKDTEIQPRKKPNTYFEKVDTKFDEDYIYKTLTYEQRINKFNEELKLLRKKYIPFMENRLPKCNKEGIKPKEFEFRYLEKDEVFVNYTMSESKWEKVYIPDFRGPTNEKGKWRACYKTQFKGNSVSKSERIILAFECVDYKALVYLNGNFIGQHEGLFAPFEFDITNYILEDNELIVECQNDIPILGVGNILDGDKIYAATGPGWDDSEYGWHHCPSGAGIFGEVSVETRPSVYIEDIFVRPNIDEDFAEIRVGIYNYQDTVLENYKCFIQLLPKNHEGEKIASFEEEVKYVGIGKNEYRFTIPLKHYKLWDFETPFLYGAVVELKKDLKVVSTRCETFGIKKFVCDESSNPKGKLYFNNEPIILRGANEMGHLQQCVMKDDIAQLIDDILIAKLCNLNYYRITQRPVQRKIYEYFDMLGMLHQCDFPLFGFLRRNQFNEAIKQVTEMEHLVRKHVSTVMVTFINEAMCIRKEKDVTSKFSKRYEAKGHRHLLRDELEAFFVAARKAIYIENPDRVIKNVEGDYDGPTEEGMPDFHCYTMWYSNHGQPIGKLIAGYLPPVKAGWMMGCGEYGAEGLEDIALMKKHYPKEWLEKDEKGNWYPSKIVRAQTYSMHGDWYKEQKNYKSWVVASQQHQANATKMLTDAFRRRADIINHTAIHLLIDAWPSGWMKALVSCDRMPKRAYFAYQDVLEAIRVNLVSQRNYVYSEELVDVEGWLLNDTSQLRRLNIYVRVKVGSKQLQCYHIQSSIEAVSSRCCGRVRIAIPTITSKTELTLEAIAIDEQGQCVNSECIQLMAYPKLINKRGIGVLGDAANQIAQILNIEDKQQDIQNTKILLSSDLTDEGMKVAEKVISSGGKVVLLVGDKCNEDIVIGEIEFTIKPTQQVFFAATDKKYDEYTLTMLYNKEVDHIDFIGERYIETSNRGNDLVYSYKKGGFDKNGGPKPKLPFVKSFKCQKGKLIVVSLCLEGRVGQNANLDKFIEQLLMKE